MKKIIIIDDDKLLRDMLCDTLNGVEDFEVIGSASDAKDSVTLCKKLLPDLVLMDVCTENNSNGISYAKTIKESFPSIKVIIMTSVLDINFINSAKEASVDSFVYKSIGKDSLIYTIQNTLDGYSMYPDTKKAKNNILSELTEKELEILTLYCKLLDREQVALKLNISDRTLKTHISSIYHKTGFDNLPKLSIYCISNGLIVPNLEDAK
jgi:DNA-binding NarL/FixJ family response regulator